MQDMNFFIQFNSKKKNSDLSTIILSIFVTIIVGFIIITCAYNNISTYINNKEADEFKAKVEEPATQKKIKESEQVNNKINMLNKYDKDITEITNAIKTRDIVNIDLLNKVSSTLPSDITVVATQINESSVQLQGVSKNRVAVAELEHNLRELKDKSGNKYFISVFVSTVAGDENYAYQITCGFKDGDNNESK